MNNDNKQNQPKEQDQPSEETKTTEQAARTEPHEGQNEPHVDEKGELQPDPLEQLQIEIADLKDRYLRQAAEMDNLRKRTEREKADMAKYAVSEFARDILTLSDNFQRAIEAVPGEAAAEDETLNSFLEGVKMNERELQKVLERHGVTQINPKGEKFDPNKHQAVQQVEDAELPNDTVVDVYQVGYVIADRILRPAIVSVAKGGPKSTMPHSEPPLTLPDQEPAQPEAPETAPTPEEATAPDSPDNIGANVDKNA